MIQAEIRKGFLGSSADTLPLDLCVIAGQRMFLVKAGRNGNKNKLHFFLIFVLLKLKKQAIKSGLTGTQLKLYSPGTVFPDNRNEITIFNLKRCMTID
jgi:hypothetical protein